ncbi:alpha/beta fold hydrolase [Dokdonella sp. MW10]|uniref:alpha/beta fold hydrolase n=1 Tax=Dokdonella sp. MW10 TaxID=2992926 RepID=UPI003F7E0194
MTGTTFEDLRVDTQGGAVLARRWHAETLGLAPIVLLHDSLGSIELWRDWPERLVRATGRDVVAYDRLGFGRSDAHPGTLDDRFIHDESRGAFARVLEAFAIGRFVAFGHSVGGGMAIGCAAAFGERCEALVTLAAQAFVEDRTLAGVAAAKLAFAQPGQLERLARYHGEKARWVLDAWLETWLAPGFASWTLDDILGDVHCPPLVVHGDLDEYGSVAHAERIAHGVSGPARLEILAGVGHVPHRERGDEVMALVTTWLAKGSRDLPT